MEIKMPKLDVTMTEGTFMGWLVPDGANVSAGRTSTRWGPTRSRWMSRHRAMACCGTGTSRRRPSIRWAPPWAWSRREPPRRDRGPQSRRWKVGGRGPRQRGAAVAEAVRRLRARQPEWEDLGVRGRAKWLLCYQDWLIDNATRLTDVVQSETGKSRCDAEIEAPAAIDLVKYWVRHAGRSWPTSGRRHTTLSG